MDSNVVLHLLFLMGGEKNKVRQIMGMCQEHSSLRRMSYFIVGRLRNAYEIFSTFIPNLPGGCEVAKSTAGGKHTFSKEHHSVILRYLIFEGVYRWTVQISEAKHHENFYLGAIPSDVIDYYENRRMDEVNSWLGNIHGCDFGIMYKSVHFLNFTCSRKKIGCFKMDDPENLFLTIEVDASLHTLSFFINERKIPLVITRILTPLYLGITTSRYQTPTLVSVAFSQLRAPTASPVQCTHFESVCVAHPPLAVPLESNGTATTYLEASLLPNAGCAIAPVQIPRAVAAAVVSGIGVDGGGSGRWMWTGLCAKAGAEAGAEAGAGARTGMGMDTEAGMVTRERCVFTKNATVYLDHLIADGVVQWTVQIAYNTLGWPCFNIGATPAAVQEYCGETSFGTDDYSLGWDYPHTSSYFRICHSGFMVHNVKHGSLTDYDLSIPDQTLVTLEADAIARTLSLFVNNRKVPVEITEMAFPLRLGIYGSKSGSFTSISLQQVPHSTPWHIPSSPCPSDIMIPTLGTSAPAVAETVPVAFRPVSASRLTILATPHGPCCVFEDGRSSNGENDDSRGSDSSNSYSNNSVSDCGGSTTVFFDKCITEGIYRWTVSIIRAKKYKMGFGAAVPSALHHSKPLGFVPGTCSLYFSGGDYDFLERNTFVMNLMTNSPIPDSDFCNALDMNTIDNKSYASLKGLISIEADMDKRSLSFAVDGKDVPIAVKLTDISSLYLGISGTTSSSFTVVSFCRLSAPTPSRIQQRFVKYSYERSKPSECRPAYETDDWLYPTIDPNEDPDGAK